MKHAILLLTATIGLLLSGCGPSTIGSEDGALLNNKMLIVIIEVDEPDTHLIIEAQAFKNDIQVMLMEQDEFFYYSDVAEGKKKQSRPFDNLLLQDNVTDLTTDPIPVEAGKTYIAAAHNHRYNELSAKLTVKSTKTRE